MHCAETERCQVRRRRDVNPPRRELLECQPGRRQHCGQATDADIFLQVSAHGCDASTSATSCRSLLKFDEPLASTLSMAFPTAGASCSVGLLVTGACVGSGVPVSWAKLWLGYLARLTQVKSVRAPSDGTVARLRRA